MDIVNEYEVFLNVCGIENEVIIKVYATSKDEAYDTAIEAICSIKHNDCESDGINLTRRNVNV